MSPPDRIAVLTTGRQDFGIIRSTLLALRDHPRMIPLLWVGGMHLATRFGQTVTLIEADGFHVDRRLPFVSEGSDPIAETADALTAVAEAIAADAPDCLLLVGDRSETVAAGVAATLRRLPIVHLHGGEETQGAIDNAFRHALTKLSHLHLVSHPTHADRVLQMGEDPSRVVVVGSPGLDNLDRDDLLDHADLARALGTQLSPPVAVVTVHPTTLSSDVLAETRAVTSALDEHIGTVIVTAPNSDAGAQEIRSFMRTWTADDEDRSFVDALGDRLYWSLLRTADIVVGNSSSGIIEAPVAGVPVVNVGDRQLGRQRPDEFVWDCPSDASAVAEAVAQALSSAVRSSAPDPRRRREKAAPRILAALDAWNVPNPPVKVFRSRP